MIRSILVLVVLTLATYAQAEQLVFLIEQERTVQGSVDDNVANDTQTATAPDNQTWVETVSATLAEPGVYEVTAGGGQYSEISEDAFRAYGLADTAASGDVNAWAFSESVYRVRFAVAESVTYHLTGTLAAYADAGEYSNGWEVFASATASLDKIAGPAVFTEQAQVDLLGGFDPISDERSLDLVGTLSPGVYELEIRGTIDAPLLWLWFPVEEPPVYGEATFVVDVSFARIELEPECTAADVNEDGAVDMADFWRLQACFTGP